MKRNEATWQSAAHVCTGHVFICFSLLLMTMGSLASSYAWFVDVPCRERGSANIDGTVAGVGEIVVHGENHPFMGVVPDYNVWFFQETFAGVGEMVQKSISPAGLKALLVVGGWAVFICAYFLNILGRSLVKHQGWPRKHRMISTSKGTSGDLQSARGTSRLVSTRGTSEEHRSTNSGDSDNPACGLVYVHEDHYQSINALYTGLLNGGDGNAERKLGHVLGLLSFLKAVVVYGFFMALFAIFISTTVYSGHVLSFGASEVINDQGIVTEKDIDMPLMDVKFNIQVSTSNVLKLGLKISCDAFPDQAVFYVVNSLALVAGLGLYYALTILSLKKQRELRDITCTK
jgi:hypothetical protein